MNTNLFASVRLFGGEFAPRGFKDCNGELLEIPSYTPVFALIGVTFGGDGRTNFAVPDLSAAESALNSASKSTRGARFLIAVDGNFPARDDDSPKPEPERSVSGWFACDFIPDDHAVHPGTSFPGVTLTGQAPKLFGDPPSLPVMCSTKNPIPSEPMLAEIGLVKGAPPKGWAHADGAELPIRGNDALFSVIGSKFGGDAQTNFKLPDYRSLEDKLAGLKFFIATTGVYPSHP